MRIVVAIVIFLSILSIATCCEPEEFTKVRSLYTTLREHLESSSDDERFKKLVTPYILVGMLKPKNHIGYNTNKGYEIGICLNGDINEIFHVLLHELAHCTVEEFDHSAEFWNNLRDLKSICVDLGIYTEIKEPKEFCGTDVQDA